MKASQGRLSKEQREYGVFLTGQGYDFWVCRSAEDAQERIIKYLELAR